MINLRNIRFGTVGLILFSVLFGCEVKSNQKNDAFAVGGTLNGLASGTSVVLQNNGDEDLLLETNGSFVFATRLSDKARYDIRVIVQPEDQTCVVTQGSGNIEGADVTDVRVTCAGVDAMYSVGGALSGLASGATVVLRNNGDDDLVLTANGSFEFASKLADGVPYDVNILTAPEGQICSVSNPSGTISKSDVTNISVVCAAVDNAYTVGGTVAGLEGKGLVLQINSGDDLEVTNNGEFTFNTAVANGSAYSVTVAAQPTAPDQICSVTHATGTVDGADIADVMVLCVGPTAAVSIGSFSVSAQLVSPGDEVTLSWITQNANSCTINNGEIEAKQTNMGNVTVTVNSEKAFVLTCEGADEPVSSNPVTVYVTDSDWVKVSACSGNTCAIKRDGRLFCWGGSYFMSPERGFVPQSIVAIPLQEETAANDWVDVSAGGSVICAIKRDGRLFCWRPVPISAAPPFPVTTPFFWPSRPSQESTEANDWTSVSSGSEHVCAIKSDGRLFCWGSNSLGQLGTNSDEDSLEPEQEYTAATDWAEVSSGVNSTCAIKNDGRLFCWGNNAEGQLGNDSIENSLVPVQEQTAATDWVQVSLKNDHACALKDDGRLFCWGSNIGGQLGNDSNEESRFPVQENTTATDWAAVITGSYHTCGLKRDGRLFCWGRGQSGELGNRAITSMVPLQEKTHSTDWTQVSLGSSHTYALKDDGRLFCWGYHGGYIGRPDFGPVWPAE